MAVPHCSSLPASLPPARTTAECYNDGEWHKKDHPKCVESFGDPPASDQHEPDPGGSVSAETKPEPSRPKINAGYVARLNEELFGKWSPAHLKLR